MNMTPSTGTHLTEDELVLHYYGEMADADEAAAGAHLASCEMCRREYLALQRLLGLVDAVPDAADVPAGFERTVWARLERDLPRRSPGFMAGLLSPLPLAFAAAVLLLVTGAFFAGRTLAPGPGLGSSDASATRRLQEQILLAEVGAHLDRSQMVLVDLVSGAGDDGLDVSFDRGRAEQLVADNRLYRLTAAQTGDAPLRELLDEIERVLTELAASPSVLPPDAAAALRRRVEARDLLFRLRVIGAELRDRDAEALRRRADGPPSADS